MSSIGILPLQEAVLFPNTVIPLAVVKKPGILLVEEALREGKPIGLTVLKDREIENPGPEDVYRIGTIGTVQKMLKVPDGTLRCIVAGQQVFKIEKFEQTEPYMIATYTELPDVTTNSEEIVAMQRNLAGLFQKLLGYLPQAPREMEMEVQNITDPNLLSYFVASTMRLETADRQAILEERNTAKRMRKLTMMLTKESKWWSSVTRFNPTFSARWKKISASFTCVSSCAPFRKSWARWTRSKPKPTNCARRSMKRRCPKMRARPPIASWTA